VLGTPDYISPEAARGEKNLDFRSDLYSLGTTLYHMLSGNPPFGGSVSDVMDQHIKSEPKSISSVVKDLPPKMVEVVERLMKKKPADRYQNFSELLNDLDEVRRAAKSSVPATGMPSASVATMARPGSSQDSPLARTVKNLKIGVTVLGVLLAAAIAFIVYLLANQPGIE
jgi:serine/threonine-protein kinase